MSEYVSIEDRINAILNAVNHIQNVITTIVLRIDGIEENFKKRIEELEEQVDWTPKK